MSDELYRLMYRTQLDLFSRLAFEVVHTGEALLDNWHIDALAYRLSAFMQEPGSRLRVNLPPRSLKSFMTSIAFPAFHLGNDPRLKILILAGTPDLANDLREKIIKLMRSNRYRSIFPIDFTTPDRRLVFPEGGSLAVLRYGEPIIGKGYDLIIVDDPQSPSQAEDETHRERVVSYFQSDVQPRLNSQRQGRIAVVQQRLHSKDLSGSLSAPAWSEFVVSAVSADIEEWRTALGPFIRPKGAALCEQRESKNAIEQQLNALGAEKFAAQYLQEPYLGVVRHFGSAKAWMRPPPDWDGKEPMNMIFFVRPDPEQEIRELFFDGPPWPYVWNDPNPPMTLEEWEARAVPQQAESVRQAQENFELWLKNRNQIGR